MIRYQETVEGISAENLQGFFVDWPNPPNPTTHLKLLQKSDHIVLAIDEATGHVIGFITAITDHVLTAYIPLLEVLPAYKGQGIGSQLVKQMQRQLRHLYAIDLLCDLDVQPFYARLGMIPATGMLTRNYTNQSGSAETR